MRCYIGYAVGRTGGSQTATTPINGSVPRNSHLACICGARGAGTGGICGEASILDRKQQGAQAVAVTGRSSLGLCLIEAVR